jgi:hypothetical protein
MSCRSTTRSTCAPVPSAHFLPSVRQRPRQTALQACCACVAKGWDHGRHQAVEDAVAVGRQCGKYPISETYRIESRLDRNSSEILACGLKDVSNRTVAVIDTIDHRFGKIHEPPHQIQRQVGVGSSDPIHDHPPLQVEVCYKLPPLLPVDEGLRFSQSGDAFADLGSDAVAACLRGQFQT